MSRFNYTNEQIDAHVAEKRRQHEEREALVLAVRQDIAIGIDPMARFVMVVVDGKCHHCGKYVWSAGQTLCVPCSEERGQLLSIVERETARLAPRIEREETGDE